MTYLTSWEEFAKAAEKLYIADPMRVRIHWYFLRLNQIARAKIEGFEYLTWPAATMEVGERGLEPQ